jgi:branched-chain amino acid transport system ATP-binding protein
MSLMLQVDGLAAGYGPAQVLFDVSLKVDAGEVVSLLGRNGMGKTTTINTIMGLLPARAGMASFQGRTLTGLPPYLIAQAGIGLVPEGRQIFPALSVEENLIATAASRFGGDDPWTLGRVYELFPKLIERREHMGGQLSGGEQQMLAIGRALMTNPKLLILDEATEGLAPLIRGEIWACLARLKRAGQAILIVDKHLRALLKLLCRTGRGSADRATLSTRMTVANSRADSACVAPRRRHWPRMDCAGKTRRRPKPPPCIVHRSRSRNWLRRLGCCNARTTYLRRAPRSWRAIVQ